MQPHTTAWADDRGGQGDNLGPVIAMTKSEAVALFSAVDRSRTRLVVDIGRITRARSMTPPEKVAAQTVMRRDLKVLEDFARALGEAHGLGGY